MQWDDGPLVVIACPGTRCSDRSALVPVGRAIAPSFVASLEPGVLR